MRAIRLITFILLSIAVAATLGNPIKRQNTRFQQPHAARQIASTSPSTMQAKTGYPPSGFRPHIPFELPNERKPKELPDVENTPVTEDAVTTATPDSSAGTRDVDFDVEVIVESNGEEESDENVIHTKVITTTTTEAPKNHVADDEIEVQVEVNNETTETEVEIHTPANEYGPPPLDGAEKVEEPAEEFQPPNKDAEEFIIPQPNGDDTGNAANNDGASDAGTPPVEPIANFPKQETDITPAASSMDDNNSGAVPNNVSGELDAEAAEQPIPAATYGPPTDVDDHLPAETYGIPGGEVVPPEVEEEDFGLELNELEPMTEKDEGDLAAEQIELLKGLSEFQSGRLIFVPSDGSNLRQIFFAAPRPQQSKSERLIRT